MVLVEFEDSVSHVEWLGNVILRELSDFELAGSLIQKRVEHPWGQASIAFKLSSFTLRFCFVGLDVRSLTCN